MAKNTNVFEIPWDVAVLTFKPHYLAALLSQGKSLDEAKALFEQLKNTDPDDELLELVKKLVDKVTSKSIRE